MTDKGSTAVIIKSLDAGFRLLSWLAVGLLVLFWCSGIQQVEPEQVGLLLRFGKLQGSTPIDRVKEPGLVLALPYPIDSVLRIPAKQEGEVNITDVWKDIRTTAALDVIDPVLEGYCLTGDQNVVQAQVIVKYRISDPIAYRLRVIDPEAILHNLVLAALTQTIAEWDVDDVLRLQRRSGVSEGNSENLGMIVWQRAQARLDQLSCGVAISALEFKQIHPPRHVIPEFRAVQSAKIEIDTKLREAEGYAAREIPGAEADRDRRVKAAAARRSARTAEATAELAVFDQLYTEYRANPGLVSNRIYLETIEQVLNTIGRLDFVAPGNRIILSDAEVAE